MSARSEWSQNLPSDIDGQRLPVTLMISPALARHRQGGSCHLPGAISFRARDSSAMVAATASRSGCNTARRPGAIPDCSVMTCSHIDTSPPWVSRSLSRASRAEVRSALPNDPGETECRREVV